MPHYNLPHNHGQNIEKVLNKMPSAEGFKDISFLFQQLGDPTRLRILWLLCHCEECVCNLAAAVDMSAPAVSHHLRILKKSGIISSRRDGKEVYYSLSDTPLARLAREAWIIRGDKLVPWDVWEHQHGKKKQWSETRA